MSVEHDSKQYQLVQKYIQDSDESLRQAWELANGIEDPYLREEALLLLGQVT